MMEVLSLVLIQGQPQGMFALSTITVTATNAVGLIQM